MRFPSIRLEIRDRPSRYLVGWSPRPGAMRALLVKIGFESQQLAFQIGSCPELRTIQLLSAEGGDQPFHKGMGQWNIGNGLDLGHLRYPQVGLPLSKPITGTVVGAEVFRD